MYRTFSSSYKVFLLFSFLAMITSGFTLNVSSLNIGFPFSSNPSSSMSSSSLSLAFCYFLVGFGAIGITFVDCLRLSLQKCWSQNTISAVATIDLISSASNSFRLAINYSSSSSDRLLRWLGTPGILACYLFIKSINSIVLSFSWSFLASSLLFLRSSRFVWSSLAWLY